MNAIVQFVMSHGYSILFAAVFARQIGLPVPANLFVLAAGALSAAGKLRIPPAMSLAIIACVVADWLWYEAGRQKGEKVLHFIHRFSPDPAAADRRSREKFAHYGPSLVLVAKFVPGLDLVAPPLAGVSGTSRIRFLTFETSGAALWSAANISLGYIFSHDLNRAAAYVGRAGTFLGTLAIALLSVYAIRKFVRSKRTMRGVPRLREAITTKLRAVGEVIFSHRQYGSRVMASAIPDSHVQSDMTRLLTAWPPLSVLPAAGSETGTRMSSSSGERKC